MVEEHLGWFAIDSKGHVWRDTDFNVVGKPTAWSQLVSYLEVTGKHLTNVVLKWGSFSFTLPPQADQYAIHYNVTIELGKENVARHTIVGTAIQDNLAIVRVVDEDGHTDIVSVYANQAQIMKPSPLAPKE